MRQLTLAKGEYHVALEPASRLHVGVWSIYQMDKVSRVPARSR